MRRVALIAVLIAGSAAAEAKVPCALIEGSAALVAPGARVILGEMHGNTASPRFAAELACAAAQRAPTVVALEIYVTEQKALDQYLASSGTAKDRKQLFSREFWNESYQDGRRTEAMVALLDKVRQLAKAGSKVSVLAFDPRGADREATMADTLHAAFVANPASTFVVLVGNIHARKTKRANLNYALMTQLLVKYGDPVIALNADYPMGSSWVCWTGAADSCGPVLIGIGVSGRIRESLPVDVRGA